jgi:hypothetical protein
VGSFVYRMLRFNRVVRYAGGSMERYGGMEERCPRFSARQLESLY